MSASVSALVELGLQTHSTLPAFYMSSEEADSNPHAYTASNLLTEPCPELHCAQSIKASVKFRIKYLLCEL